MRGWKIAAAVIGVIIALFVVNTVVHLVLGLIIDVVIAAIVAGGIYVAIKMARSGKQVSGKSKDSEIRDRRSSSALSRSDLDEYIAPAPAPRPASRPATSRPAPADVDDELARLKREMGS